MLALACCVLLVACASTKTSGSAQGGALYLCGCGPDCKCTTVAVKPGKCHCGKDLVAAHPLKIEEGSVLACSCGAKCTCTADASDAAKCGCGKPIRKASLNGSGLYYCGCGGSCCATVSEKPGKCKCGKELVKAD